MRMGMVLGISLMLLPASVMGQSGAPADSATTEEAVSRPDSAGAPLSDSLSATGPDSVFAIEDSLAAAGRDSTDGPRAPALPDTLIANAEPDGPRVTFEIYLENAKGQPSLLGLVRLGLFQTAAPKHAANFLKLVESGFYEGVAIHRIVPSFILQGGDPKSRINWQAPDLGTGGPPYTLPAEIALAHQKGAVAAARQDDAVNVTRESNGSQFFICLSDLPSLDTAGYTVFGKILRGMEVLEKVANVKNAGAENYNRALSRVYLKNVRVMEPEPAAPPPAKPEAKNSSKPEAESGSKP